RPSRPKWTSSSSREGGSGGERRGATGSMYTVRRALPLFLGGSLGLTTTSPPNARWSGVARLGHSESSNMFVSRSAATQRVLPHLRSSLASVIVAGASHAEAEGAGPILAAVGPHRVGRGARLAWYLPPTVWNEPRHGARHRPARPGHRRGRFSPELGGGGGPGGCLAGAGARVDCVHRRTPRIRGGCDLRLEGGAGPAIRAVCRRQHDRCQPRPGRPRLAADFRPVLAEGAPAGARARERPCHRDLRADARDRLQL